MWHLLILEIISLVFFPSKERYSDTPWIFLVHACVNVCVYANVGRKSHKNLLSFWFVEHLISICCFQGEIEKALPSGGGAHASESSGVVQKLRKLMEEVETIKAEREVIENEFKEAKFDMSK